LEGLKALPNLPHDRWHEKRGKEHINGSQSSADTDCGGHVFALTLNAGATPLVSSSATDHRYTNGVEVSPQAVSPDGDLVRAVANALAAACVGWSIGEGQELRSARRSRVRPLNRA
jgi:hypothetical protein